MRNFRLDIPPKQGVERCMVNVLADKDGGIVRTQINLGGNSVRAAVWGASQAVEDLNTLIDARPEPPKDKFGRCLSC